MRTIIILINSFLITSWVWGTDWSTRNFNIDITGSLVTKTYTTYLRGILLILMIFYLSFQQRKKLGIKFIILPILTLSGIYYLRFGMTNTWTYNFLISSIVLIFLKDKSNYFLKKSTTIILYIMIIIGFLYYLFFEQGCLSSALCSNIGFTTYANEFLGNSNYNNRFVGFFGGPIILSILSGIIISKNLIFNSNKTFNFYINTFSFLSILFSQSIAGIFFILLNLISNFIFKIRFSISSFLKYDLKNNKKIKYLNNYFRNILKRIDQNKVKLIFSILVILIMVINYRDSFAVLRVFKTKLFFSFDFLLNNLNSNEVFGNTKEELRALISFNSRLDDFTSIIKNMSISGFIFGNILTAKKVGNFISESGLLSLISLYGLPFTSLYLYFLIKNYGIKMGLALIIINLPYNLFLLHPVCLVLPILFQSNVNVFSKRNFSKSKTLNSNI